MPIELTREELFRQVWERPMTSVAADYDISGVALKKSATDTESPFPVAATGQSKWSGGTTAGERVKDD